MIENTILKANREGRYALVFALPFPSSDLIELAAHVGFDAITIDGEHGAYSTESVDDICRLSNAFGMSVIARRPEHRCLPGEPIPRPRHPRRDRTARRNRRRSPGP